MTNAIAIICHLLAINLWFGGTFYSVIILPRAVSALSLADQHQILLRAFSRFFNYAWLAIVLLLVSGCWMVMNIFGGFTAMPLYVTLMLLIALLMVAIFSVIYFGPFSKLKKLQGDVTAQQGYVSQIRMLSKVNMILGLSIIIVIGGGPHFVI